jgi:predicted ATPase
MFDKILLSGLDASVHFRYAKDLDFFKGRESIDFKPGLNILVGPNGSGKSTVLKILGQSMCATQDGLSEVTRDTVQAGVDMMAGVGIRLRDPKAAIPPMSDKLGLTVRHDGQPVIYCDPRNPVGLNSSSFDGANVDAGIVEAMTASRRSHGEMTLHRGNAALAVLLGKLPFPDKVHYDVRREDVNDKWQEALNVLERRLVPAIPKGQPTVLLDEPEANYSLAWQAKLWTLLANPEVAQRCQVIVASHSAFALGITHANYIETKPGIRDTAEQALRVRFGA